MFILLLILHIVVALLLVLSIMLQTGQAGGLSGAFGGGGGGGAQSLFGGRGASDFLAKATTYLGAGFLVLSFLLAFVQAHRSGATSGRNIIRDVYDAPAQSETAPVPEASGSDGGLLPVEGTPEGIPATDMPMEDGTETTPAPATEVDPSGN